MIQMNLFPASLLRNTHTEDSWLFIRNTRLCAGGWGAVVNLSDSVWFPRCVQGAWKDPSCLPAPGAVSPALPCFSGFLRAVLGEESTQQLLFFARIQFYKLPKQHNRLLYLFIYFSCGSQLPRGIAEKGRVMVEFYHQVRRDHSVRNQSLRRKVIKRHVTVTGLREPRGGFSHCTHFLVICFHVMWEKGLTKALN